MSKKTLFTIFPILLLSPALVLGASNITVTSIVTATVNTTLYIASGVIVILWVITGLLFLTAQGAPDKLSLAKKALIAAVVGTLLVIVASSAISIIGPAFGLV